MLYEQDLRRFIHLSSYKKALIKAFHNDEKEKKLTFIFIQNNVELVWIELQSNLVQAPDEKKSLIVFFSCYNRTTSMLESRILKRLSAEEHDYLAVIEISQRIITMLNLRKGIEATNPRISANYEEDCIYAVKSIVVPEDQRQTLNRMALKNIISKLDAKGSYSFSFSIFTPEKKRLRKLLSYYYLDGTRTSILMTRTDITSIYNAEKLQQKKLQKALTSAQTADKAKSLFLANMSHDIRTPMNAIIGFADLALLEIKNPAQVTEYLEHIKNSGAFLMNILNDVLDMSAIEQGRFQIECKWNRADTVLALCKEMITPLLQNKHITFTENIAPELYKYEYFVDLVKMERLLMNLLNNACKFTPENGHILFQIKRLSRNEKTMTDSITVTDDGCGMSKEFLHRVFMPFAQERLGVNNTIPGTGLGLSLARTIARQMGGDITVESTLGKGSSFTITLCYPYRNLTAMPENEKTLQILKLAHLNVLLAEDNNLNAIIAQKQLTKNGCTVVWVQNGKEALDTFLSSPPHTFDAILMDMRMPVMDGVSSTKAIRNSTHPDAKEVAIIAMTANAFDTDRMLCISSGMDEYLSKPLDPSELMRTLALCTHSIQKTPEN